MKKILIAFVLGLGLSFSAMAAENNFVKFEYEFNQVDGNHDNGNQFNVQVGHKYDNGIKLDAKGEFARANNTGNLGDRFELGAGYELGFLNIRGAVGEKFTNGDQYAYYLIEPGVKVPLDQNLSVFAKYRFRDAFDSGRTEETHRVKLGAEYALTKTTAVEASVARSWGDAQYNTVQVAYAIKF